MSNDFQRLSTFLASPDAGAIIECLNKLSGPLRQSYVLHLQVMVGETPQSIRRQHQLQGPMVSESLEGRVHERKLRGESLQQIATAESISLAEVRAALKSARGSASASVGKPSEKAPSTHTRRSTAALAEIYAKVEPLLLKGFYPGAAARMTKCEPWEARNRAKQLRLQGVKLPVYAAGATAMAVVESQIKTGKPGDVWG